MAASPPLVSVVLPSYNHGRYVADAVRSVLTQTMTDLELIAWDDGSSDDSLEQLFALAKADPRMRVHSHEGGTNRGLTRTLRAAIDEARGSYLAVIASDDRWLPQRLEGMLTMMDGRDAVYCPAFVIDENGVRTGVTYGRPHVGRDLFSQLLVQNVIPAPCVLMTRVAYDDVGGYDSDALYEDLHLMVRLASRGRFGFVPEPLADYRVSARGLHQETEREAGRFAAIAGTLELIDPLALPPGAPRQQLSQMVAAWQHLLPPGCDRTRQRAMLLALAARNPIAGAKALAMVLRRRLRR